MGVFDVGKKPEERIWDRGGNPCYAICRRSYCSDSPRNNARQMGVFDVGKKPEERIWDGGREPLLCDLPSQILFRFSAEYINNARQTGVFDIGKKQEERIWNRARKPLLCDLPSQLLFRPILRRMTHDRWESLTSVRNRKNGSGTEARNSCYPTCRQRTTVPILRGMTHNRWESLTSVRNRKNGSGSGNL